MHELALEQAEQRACCVLSHTWNAVRGEAKRPKPGGNTFWNCQKANWHKGVTVGTASRVSDVSRGEVQQMKLILASGV